MPPFYSTKRLVSTYTYAPIFERPSLLTGVLESLSPAPWSRAWGLVGKEVIVHVSKDARMNLTRWRATY